MGRGYGWDAYERHIPEEHMKWPYQKRQRTIGLNSFFPTKHA